MQVDQAVDTLNTIGCLLNPHLGIVQRLWLLGFTIRFIIVVEVAPLPSRGCRLNTAVQIYLSIIWCSLRDLSWPLLIGCEVPIHLQLCPIHPVLVTAMNLYMNHHEPCYFPMYFPITGFPLLPPIWFPGAHGRLDPSQPSCGAVTGAVLLTPRRIISPRARSRCKFDQMSLSFEVDLRSKPVEDMTFMTWQMNIILIMNLAKGQPLRRMEEMLAHTTWIGSLVLDANEYEIVMSYLTEKSCRSEVLFHDGTAEVRV